MVHSTQDQTGGKMNEKEKNCANCSHVYFFGYPNEKLKCQCRISEYNEKVVEKQHFCDEFDEYIDEVEE